MEPAISRRYAQLTPRRPMIIAHKIGLRIRLIIAQLSNILARSPEPMKADCVKPDTTRCVIRH